MRSFEQERRLAKAKAKEKLAFKLGSLEAEAKAKAKAAEVGSRIYVCVLLQPELELKPKSEW